MTDESAALRRRIAELETALAASARELSAAKAQQVATANVLSVISRSAFDPQVVLEALINSAVALSGSTNGMIWRYEDGALYARAFAQGEGRAEFIAYMRAHPQRPGHGSTAARVALTGEVHNIADVREDPNYSDDLRKTVQTRATLGVPMKRGDELVGAIVMSKPEAGLYSERIVDLVKTFADQAVIAIENARLFNETQTALERQTATANVLKVISSSVSDAAPAFATILESCQRLFGLEAVAIYLVEGDKVRGVAQKGWGRGDWGRDAQPLAGSSTGQAIAERRAVHFPDIADKPDMPPDKAHELRKGGGLSVLYAPMLTEDRGVGSIVVSRKPAKPFTEKEIALIQSFADQAAIAIQNTRLFNETREALERQTATAEVLKVIASSPSDVQPVFQAIADSAKRLLAGHSCAVGLIVDGQMTLEAYTPTNQADEALMKAYYPRADWPTDSARGQILARHGFAEIQDVQALPDPAVRDYARARDFRSYLRVALTRNGAPIGWIIVTREEPGPFAPRHIQLLQIFADQAVIAIENARLFNETKEALERQTATSEILKIIASSPADAGPVFRAIATSANAVIGGYSTAVFQFVDGVAQLVAFTPVSPGADAALQAQFPAPLTSFPPFLLVRDGVTASIEDTEAGSIPAPLRDLARLRGYRSMLYTPLMHRGAPIGVIAVTRRAPGPFAQNDVQQLRAFADQAVIALQNARMFEEVQARTRDLTEALQQQTATAEVLKVISRSAFDLQAVFDALLSSAVDLVGGVGGAIALREGDQLRFRAGSSPGGTWPTDFVGRLIPIDRSSAAGRAAGSGQIEYVPDGDADPQFRRVASGAFGHSYLGVPLARDGRVEGALTIISARRHAFTQRHIELAQTFADQAVIAIENTRLFEEVQARTRDLTEALQQQTATSEVLSAISRSPTDLMPVLETISDTASRLCGSEQTIFFRYDGEVFRFLASWNFPAEVREMLERRPIWPGHPSALGRAGATLKPVCIPDVLADTDYGLKGEQMAGRYRTSMAVPLLRDGKLIGALSLNRAEPGAFTARHAEIVSTFADQAVIAIENVRLFDEVQARTRDLSEALQQQTATADVLKAISRSVFDLESVLRTLIDTAVRLCHGSRGTIFIRNGDWVEARAFHSNVPLGLRDYLLANPLPLDGQGFVSTSIREGRRVHHADLVTDRALVPEGARAEAAFGAVLCVPLMRKGEAIGCFAVPREAPQAFSAREIELIETFADQAVIAIENTRLFDEVQARTRDLSEALQQQTATAEVLKVMSRSAFDLDTIFQTLVTTAVDLCKASSGTLCVRDGGVFRYRGMAGPEATPALQRYLEDHPLVEPTRKTAAGRAILSRQVEQIEDVLCEADYSVPFSAHGSPARALLAVPLLGKSDVQGAIVVARAEPGAFPTRHVEILKSFADQAVIAIENSRLFEQVQAKTGDLEDALAQQTATADVLKVISRTAFDLQAVLDTLVASAVKLFGADNGIMYLQRGDAFYVRSAFNTTEFQKIVDRLREQPHRPGRGSVGARVLLTGEIQHVPDIQADSEYDARLRAASVGRAVLGVPLKRDGSVVGAIVFVRRVAGAYLPRQIEIAQTFADQAVIAIENSRLFDQLEARTHELERSLDDLRKAQDRLVQSEKLASLGQLTAGIAHEIKNPLNFVNNFSALSRELLEELRELLAKAKWAEDERKEGDELVGMIGSNLEKVVTHGKRADSIVKNMLLHSREGSGERSNVNVNAMVEEALNLAYHGARAEKPGFNVTIQKALDSQAGDADLYPQEMTRVLLNLISNGFYATTKRKQSEHDGGYEPTITASSRDLGDHVEICVRDNGTGIPEAVMAKMFNPFFTTKPAGEGTGLGLSLSHDIVVKQHGGTLDVATEPGAYTQFTIRLPRAGADK